MITIEELRIGSHVVHEGNICEVAGLSVTGNVITKAIKSTTKIGYNHPVHVSKLQELQTTTEILEAFGFKLQNTMWILNKINITDSRAYVAYIFAGSTRTAIGTGHVVHRLQNLIFEVTNKFPKLS